ncbi:LacI family DNA-binding transcriptional regulator [Streptomyces boncukensis]|uniref:LacI family transcriptional regulator n=1 Tax=Streptomyces boncukensis TaxID=2711219 RepID=A0A6G4WZ61_9ACTN|nr:LacI family DNA-binding transcriptional regulator [Streptomyces boncukensis]NGO70408.1 LacI family transcriptional regulator [Streptomyces boncukensis]
MRTPTIRDVAARAGVSKSLVSLVLRDAQGVRPQKRAAVLAAVEELGYRPNAAARSLSEQRTRAVGVLLNDMRNPWFVELLDGLNARLYDSGLHMLLADGHLNRRLGEDLTRTFTELRVDGLVAVGTLRDPQALRGAAGRVPTVVAGTREPALPGVDIVAGDDEHGARLATEHLLDLGHRRVAHIAGRGAVGDLRRRSFEATVREHGLADVSAVERGDLTEEGGYRATVRLLSRSPRPTAVFAVNDVTAVGALSAAEESGLAVPGDLSLVGYDNTYLSRLRHLWLTTVDGASHDVGRRAAQRLLERIEEPGRPAGTDLATPSLVVRGTTAPPTDAG